MTRKKLAIVGSHTGTRDNAPWDNPAWDIWVVNEAASKGWPKRVSAVFQLHFPVVYRNPNNVSDPGHWAWLQKDHDFPIFMQEVDPDVPASVRYPIEEARALLSDLALHWPDGRREDAKLFTSFFPYLMAKSILDSYEEVGVWGVEMGAGTEYEYQLPGVLFWTGFAAGQGVHLEFHSGQRHFQRLLYAYEGADVNLSVSYFEERLSRHQGNFESYERRHKHLKRAVERACRSGEPDKVAELVNEREQVALEQGAVAGALGQAEHMVDLLKSTEEATGMTPMVDRQSIEQAAARAGLRSDQFRAEMYRALGKAEYVWNAWAQTKSPEALAQFGKLHDEHMGAAYKTGLMQGTHDENVTYMMELDKRVEAAGGRKTVEAVKASMNGQTAEVAA